jgi:NAD+ synthase
MVNLDLNYELVATFIVNFIHENVLSNGFKKVVLGVSGGIDSATVLDLAIKALGKENVYGLIMPYKLSSRESIDDAVMLSQLYGTSYEKIPITDIADAYFSKLKITDKMRIGNFLSRIRMAILFDKARDVDAIVAGTSNKSELMLGYSTWYGDMAAGMYPIGDLYKTQVFGLGKYLKLPQKIVDKKPTADLWPGQTDEDELGAPYCVLDSIMFLLLDERKTEEEIVQLGYDESIVKSAVKRIYGTQFKRTLPPTPKISSRTLGLDFQYPHDIMK